MLRWRCAPIQHGVGVGWGLGGAITFKDTCAPRTWCSAAGHSLAHGHRWCYAEDVLQYDIGLGWGGDWVGWGNNVQGHLRTYEMLRCWTFTCTCTQTWWIDEDVLRCDMGLGWGEVGRGLLYACLAFSLVYSFCLHCLPGLFLEPGLCLVSSNSALSLLISKAVFEVQLSNRCPALPQPRHLRLIEISRQILPMQTANVVCLRKIFACADLTC